MATTPNLSWSSFSMHFLLKKPIPLDHLTSVFEADADDENMFWAGLGGKEQVFENVINGVCVQHPELVLCIESDGNDVLIHLAYIKKKEDGEKMITFSAALLNHISRMCLYPILNNQSVEKNQLYEKVSFPEDIFVPGKPSNNKKEYEFDSFMKDNIKKFLNTTSTAVTVTEDEEMEFDKNIVSPKLKEMILNEDDVNMLMEKIGVGKIRCGLDQSIMIRCTNKGHEDTNPSMNVKLTANAWRKSKKIIVSDELDKKLCELYKCDRSKTRDDHFVFISDNAVRDSSSNRIYVLYTIKKYCFACDNKC